MSSGKINIGFHINKEGNWIASIEGAIKLGKKVGVNINCLQIFAIGPKSYLATIDNDAELHQSFKKALGGRKLFIHGNYLEHPWGKNGNFGVKLVKKELMIGSKIGAEAVIIHLPRTENEKIIELIPRFFEEDSENLQEMGDNTNSSESINNSGGTTRLFLEIESYKAGEHTFETPQKIAALLQPMSKLHNFGRIGICIDTAHLWAAGVDISSKVLANKWINKFDELLIDTGLLTYDRILIHLNDQIWGLGDGKDEHAPLLFGSIWDDYNPEFGNKEPTESGLFAFLLWITKNNIYTILERKSDKPKIDGRPVISNIVSDLLMLRFMGFDNVG